MTTDPDTVSHEMRDGRQYVPSQPAVGSAQRVVPAQEATESARTRLLGRVLVAAGSQERQQYPGLIRAQATSLATTGLVVGGSGWASALRSIRAGDPDLFLLYDPVESHEFFATAEAPFPQAAATQETLLPAATLEQRVQDQIDAGASVAMTPTGYIQAGDRPALRAVIEETNTLQRDDVLVLLPLDHKWLVGATLKAIVAAVNRSQHPIAITLGDSSSDPMSHPGVLDGVHELAAMDAPPMFHKTDLAGFDAMAHGALAASVGVIASKRRATVPGQKPYAPRTNRGAVVLLDDLLRFRRSLDMQDQWYASRSAPGCDCRVCHGQPIDRFTSAEYDCVAAAQHNAIGFIDCINDASARGGFAAWWPGKVQDAIVAHETLGQYVGTRIDPPKELLAWHKAWPGSASSH